MSGRSSPAFGRSTRQRAAVMEVIGKSSGFRSAQEIHDDLSSRGERVGLTTVYRTLQSLTEVGAVDAVRSEEGETLYRRCTVDVHHHHLVCRSCGWSIEIASDEVERWATQSAQKHGFSQVTHEAEVFGFCADCTRS